MRIIEPLKVTSPGPTKRSRDFGTGRVCEQDQCYTVLSRYNPKKTCSVHTGRENVRVRGKKTAAA